MTLRREKPNKLSFLLRLLLFLGPPGIALVFLPREHARQALPLLAAALGLGVLLAVLLPRLVNRRGCRWAAGLLTAGWLGTVLLCSAVYAAGAAGPWATAPESGADRSALFGGKTVLILAPHPDDEINLAGGVIEEYVAAGSRVVIAFSSNGDVFFPAALRYREALRAAAALGIGPEDVVFLGFGSGTSPGHPLLFHADEPTVSLAGDRVTRGAGGIAPWREGVPLTREGFIFQLRDVLDTLRPDVILCCDNDEELEHRTLSILFEHAMGRLLRERPDWHPVVMRGYAYPTGWLSPEDFRCGYPGPVEAGNGIPLSRWTERLRLPVAGSAVSLLSPEMTSVGRALRCHASQDAVRRAGRLVNTDKVFFPRRTDSLLYAAELSVSSGEGEQLRDFVLSDTEDLGALSDVLDGNGWIPDPGDGERKAVFTFPEPVSIAAISLFDSPDPAANVLVCRAELDGGVSILLPAPDPRGAASVTVLDAPAVTRTLTLTLLEGEGVGFGLAELEVYAAAEEAPLPFWKFTDRDGNYIYDVLLPPEEEGVFAWTGHDLDPGAVTLSCDDPACRVTETEEGFTVSCPRGSSCTVTARGADGEILDAARFSCPRPLMRWGMEHFDYFARHRALWVWDYLRELGHKIRAAFMGG